MKNRKGLFLIAAGVLLVISAVTLAVHNVGENNEAQEKSAVLVSQLKEHLPDETKTEEEAKPSDEGKTEEDTKTADETEIEEETQIPYYLLEPNMEMPTQNIDGNDYIGVISIPACNVELPVISKTSNSALKTAPCRYYGSAYTNDLVIAAHNYRSHFGGLSNLSRGDEIIFTDIDGNVFIYEVVETEVLPANAIEEMTCGEWDLTLFTCTYGGAQRVTVRCDIKKT